MNPLWHYLFIDSHSCLAMTTKQQNTQILIFELDLKTESACLKYQYSNESPMSRSILRVFRDGNNLIFINNTDSDKVHNYTFYKLSLNEPSIEKYRQFRNNLAFSYLYYSSLFENKLFAFNESNDELNVDDFKILYCFDLNTEQLSKFELKVPASMDEMITKVQFFVIVQGDIVQRVSFWS
jgi:hypothetical protein